MIKINLRNAAGKAISFAVEVVKSEVKAYVHDVIHNSIEMIIMPRLKQWRWYVWSAILELWGKIYAIPTYRKIIRNERKMGVPLSGPAKHDINFRYEKVGPDCYCR